MGIVNRTPDSFFDGGAYLGDSAAHAHIDRLIADGADIIDVGAESTRPAAPRVGMDEQIRRLADLIPHVVEQGLMASVDTTDPKVAEHALQQGARIINSVSLEPAGELAALAASAGASLVLTHCRGSMIDMAGFSVYSQRGYDDVVGEVSEEWQRAAEEALGAGLQKEDLIFDPGLGFTKNAAQSLELCARLGEFRKLGHPILVGPSRKSYIGHIVAQELGAEVPEPADRLGGTIAAALDCVAKGATILRVHDVAIVRQALAYAAAAERESQRINACQSGGEDGA